MAVIKNTIKDNFTQIPNELLTDDRLSLGAKVVFCYVASKPTGWEVYNKEIQNALNIKDGSTIAKYWKELIETGWIERKRNMQEGKLTGGYDYILMTEISSIRKKPEDGKNQIDGKNPEHINTNNINNTNIDINTNIREEEILENNNIASNQLFNTPKTPKKKKENQFITVIQQLSANPKIRSELEKYCNFRRTRGLTIDQWQLIVEEFKNQSIGKNPDEIIACIKRCIIDGCNSLYYKTQPRTVEQIPQQHKNEPQCSELKKRSDF